MKFTVVSCNQMVAITTPVAPSGERLRVTAGVVCLQCENCMIHTWALQRWVSYYWALYKCLSFFHSANICSFPVLYSSRKVLVQCPRESSWTNLQVLVLVIAPQVLVVVFEPQSPWKFSRTSHSANCPLCMIMWRP